MLILIGGYLFLILGIILITSCISLSMIKFVDKKNELNLKFLIIIFLLFGSLSFWLSSILITTKLPEEEMKKIFSNIKKE